MTFEGYWATLTTREQARMTKADAAQAWQMAFCDGYEKGVAAFHEAVQMEREACAKVCQEIAILRLDSGMEPGCCAQVADMCNVAILKRSNAELT